MSNCLICGGDMPNVKETYHNRHVLCIKRKYKTLDSFHNYLVRKSNQEKEGSNK